MLKTYKYYSVAYGDLITILVGDKETKFQVHENVITHWSGFFRKACSSDFREAAEKLVRLPEMDVDSFASYVHWAYTGIVRVKDDEVVDLTRDATQTGCLKIQLIKLYTAADVLIDTQLRNATIGRLVENCRCSNTIPGISHVNAAYESTAEGSKLRQFLADSYMDFAKAEFFKKEGGKLPKEFLVDLLERKMSQTKPTAVSASLAVIYHEDGKYHEHDESS